MQGVNVQVARPVRPEELEDWYKEHKLSPDDSGVFKEMPYEDGPVTRDTILEQVEKNSLRRDVPNLPTREYTNRIMVYVGGGPTLKYFLDDIKAKCESDKYDVFTSNKTCSWLLSKGIKPNYHIIVDPTERKVKDLDYEEPVDLVLGLQCHPVLFERAKQKGVGVCKFLAASITNHDGRTDRDAAREACYTGDPVMLGIGGGSMCGTRMIYFAAARGYRRLEFYGVDGSIEMRSAPNEAQVVSCYAYFKPRGENIIETTAGNGRVFYSTITLARQGEELVTLLDILPGLDVEFYGDSLMANQHAIYKELRAGKPYRATPEYLAMQKKMHRETNYGTAGGVHAARVFMAACQIHKKLGKCDVLDYGSGPGALFNAMRKCFPDVPGISLHEYDPAVEGKDAEPNKADLVFCGDVLEHVEPECVDSVIRHLSDLTGTLLIVAISLREAKKTLPDGRNAHISLHPKDWWLSKLRRHFVISEEYATPTDLIAVCARFPQ